MKKILIISGVFPPEQVTSALLNFDLAHELAKENEVTVLRPLPTRPMGTIFDCVEVSDHSFKTIIVKSYTHAKSSLFGRFRESVDFGVKSTSYIKEHKDDIDFVYNDGWQLFGLSIVARICVKLGIPYIVPVQDIYPESLFTNRRYPKIAEKVISSLLLPMDRYCQKHALNVRTISDEMANYLSSTRGIDMDKYLILDNWQNEEDFAYYPVESGRLVFGYVGSVNAHSNTELIIKAFAKAGIDDSELRVYGGGNHKDACVQLVKDLGLRNVKFAAVDKKQVPEVQSKCGVLVLALPLGNGALCLPSKMTSYMLSGRAILASVEKSATTRYIAEAGCGIAVEPDDEDSLAGAFRKFAAMPLVELNRLGRNSREFAEKRLTRNANLPKVIGPIMDLKTK